MAIAVKVSAIALPVMESPYKNSENPTEKREGTLLGDRDRNRGHPKSAEAPFVV